MKYHILTYYVNSTYAKLAPDTPQNKKMKEIMRYAGGGGDTGHPLFASSQKSCVIDEFRNGPWAIRYQPCFDTVLLYQEL